MFLKSIMTFFNAVIYLIILTIFFIVTVILNKYETYETYIFIQNGSIVFRIIILLQTMKLIGKILDFVK